MWYGAPYGAFKRIFATVFRWLIASPEKIWSPPSQFLSSFPTDLINDWPNGCDFLILRRISGMAWMGISLPAPSRGGPLFSVAHSHDRSR